MIAFTPTDDQQQLIDTIHRYATQNVRPAAHDADEADSLPSQLVQTGWEIGLVPTALPEAMGGLGEMSAINGVLAAEELAYGDLSLALAVMQPALFAYPVSLYGTAEQREQWLPSFLGEQPFAATAALLEPGILFDAHDLKTTATTEGDRVHLNGIKAYVPGGAEAEIMLVYARDSETGSTDAYLVHHDRPGLEITAREKLMGIRAMPTYRVALNDVVVEAACKLGGTAGSDYTALLNRSNVALASLAVGVARAASEFAREYAKQRVAFGVPIAQKQAIAFMLAEMAIEVDAARLLAWEAAWQLDQAESGSSAEVTKAAYLARQYANKASLFVTDSAVQVLGGYGFIREYPVERWLRNARGFTTFDGMAIV